MSVTVTYKVAFLNGTSSPKPGSTKLARRLALAHAIDRLLEAGVLKSYTEAAEVLGVTTASMSKVSRLLFLCPTIQEAILSGELSVRERRLWGVVMRLRWEEQGKAIHSIGKSRRAI